MFVPNNSISRGVVASLIVMGVGSTFVGWDGKWQEPQENRLS